MDIDANEVVTVELDCDGWTSPYSRSITRRQLGELLMQIDDMAGTTDAAQEARRDAEPWPTPETAYATAPGVVYEIGWVAHYATNRPSGTEEVREFWLRKAALLDRIALGDTDTPADPGAAKLAIEAAGRLRDIDGADVSCDPRHYVRQQYAVWAKEQ